MPGDLGTVGSWLHNAEAVLDDIKVDENNDDHDAIANIALQKINENEVRDWELLF